MNSWVLGMAKMAATSLAILPITGRGVLAGAMIPVTLVQPKLGRPASLKVGTWGQGWQARLPGDRDRFQSAGIDKRDHSDRDLEGHLHPAAEQVGGSRARSLVGDVYDFCPRHLVEKLARQMNIGAYTRRGEVELPGLALTSAMNSCRLLAGTDGWSTSTIRVFPMVVTPTKSLDVSKGRLGNRLGMLKNAPPNHPIV